MIGTAIVKVAQTYLSLREKTGHNDGPVIDRMFDYLGLPHGLSWCLAFVVWCSHLAVNPVPYPKIARCSLFFETVQEQPWKYDVFDAEDVAWGINKVEPGAVMIFAHSKIAGKNNWNGHAALVERVKDRRTWGTIEGNTNAAGSREGDGVYRKVRTARQGGLSLEGFVVRREKI